ncbi:MAG: hypothetical protein U0174_09895 [Polyangiaceae bacterium]
MTPSRRSLALLVGLSALVSLTACSKRPPTLRNIAVGWGRGCGISKKAEVWCFPGLDAPGKVTARAEIIARDADEVAVATNGVFLRYGEKVRCGGACSKVTEPSEHALRIKGGDTLFVLETNGALYSFDLKTGNKEPRIESGVVDFAVGVYGLLARKQDSTVVFQQTGEEKSPPTIVPSFRGATSLAVGGGHACVVLPSAEVHCFGTNDFGQLGDGTQVSRKTPVPVVSLQGAIEVTAGDDFSCARLGNGTVSCWGNNEQHQLTSGGPGQRSATPLPVFGVFGATMIASYGRSSCAALGQEEGARCWGNGTFGIPTSEAGLRVPMPVRFPKK